MSRFDKIDAKLKTLADSLNATLSINRPNNPIELRTFEERRIDWVDQNLNKAIIIQPTFELNGVNSKLWNLINIAWINDLSIHPRPQWRKNLVNKEDFELIDSQIDNLLLESLKNLESLNTNDLM